MGIIIVRLRPYWVGTVSTGVGVADGLVVVGGWRVIDVSGVGLRGAGVEGEWLHFFLFFLGGGCFVGWRVFLGCFGVVLLLFSY